MFGKCQHPTEPGTGRSTEVEVRLWVKQKGLPEGNYGPNVLAFTAESYVIAEVNCKKCGRQISRASIKVEPEDLATDAYYPPGFHKEA